MKMKKGGPADSWEWGARAEGLRRRRRWSDALTCFNRALRLNPLDTASREAYRADLLGKAECLRELGRLRDAARCEAEARELFARRRQGRSADDS